jgi:cobalt/nickel transport system permease protein
MWRPRRSDIDDAALARFDPRWKLAAVLCAAVAVVFVRNPFALASIFLFVVALCLFAHVDRWRLHSRLGLAVLVLSPFALLQILAGNASEAWWASTMRLYARALTLVSLALFVAQTTPLTAGLKAAHCLFIPSLLLQIGLLTWRYVHVFGGELRRLRVAMHVRGFRARANRHTYRSTAHLAGALLVRGFERAERVAQAMRCRGYDGRFHSLARLRTRVIDVWLFLLIVGPVLAICVADFLHS